MKKMIVAFLLLLLIAVACIYLFIPGHVTLEESLNVKASPQATVRALSREKNWHKWWPMQTDTNSFRQLTYGNSSYTINERFYNGFKIDILRNRDSIHSRLNLIPLNIDSVRLEWSAVMATSANPLERILKYERLKALKTDIRVLLSALKNFLDKQENIYGLNIHREIVQDTLLVATRKILPAYPSTSEIYGLVKMLRDQISTKGGKETNSPMLNVTQLEPNAYQVMVAIPIEKEIAVRKPIEEKRMVQGYILVADVKGGPARIKEAFDEMNHFINDYSRTPIAIPFSSLITDREQETDTSKWVTRIYFPIVL